MLYEVITIVVPTLNLEEVDQRCGMINHVQQVTETPVKIAAIQSFAFGGVNTCIFIKKWDDDSYNFV